MTRSPLATLTVTAAGWPVQAVFIRLATRRHKDKKPEQEIKNRVD
jgi:hypothetical protein